MNILLTNECNRRCTYCFAQERVSFRGAEERSGAPRFISEADFRTAIDFARRGEQRVVGLLGGEPSLHPEFVKLVRITVAAGIQAKIFSNALWREEQLEEVAALPAAERERVNVVVNMNEPSRTPRAQREAQARLLARLGPQCSLSFNISRLDFDPSFLVETIQRYRMRPSIRLGVAQPLAQLPNEHVDVAEYPRLAPTLLELARACDEHDVRLGFDCGFTLCMFTAEEHGRLLLAGARFKSVCGPAIDVGTDLSTWACFPLSTFAKGELLTDFDGLPALADFFRKKLKPLFNAGALPECVGCRHRKRKQCSGGCAAHVYRRLNP